MSQTSPKVNLPPAPSLDVSHLTDDITAIDKFGQVAALVPRGEHYRSARPDAPALVLLPGMGMDGLGFIRQLPLGAHADLHLFQTPSEQYPGEDGLNCFARIAEEYILKKGLDQRPGGVILGGCSMGGALSLAIARRKRIKLRGLILIGTFGSSRHLPLWQRIGAPLAWVLPVGMVRRGARLFVARTRYFGRITPEESAWLVSCKVMHSQTYFGRAVAALTRMEQIPEARGLRVPTLVLHGTHDRVLPYKAGVELAESIPGARLVTVEDSGHAFFFTHHEIVNAAIAAFLDELQQRPA